MKAGYSTYIGLAIPFFFLLIGVELLVARWQKKSLYRFNDTITDLSCGIGQQVTGLFQKAILFAGYSYLYENFRLITFPEGSAAVWIAAFFGVDLCYYWWHRMSHQVNFMWAVHVVHHQSEEYNLSVALRQAWFSSATGWFFYAPLALIGIPAPIYVAMGAFNTLYQFWIHTRTIGKLGPFEWLFNTPSHHRVHHGRNLKYIDRNHGGTLIVWDKLFGTFQVEEEEPLYGTVKPYESWNPVWANFSYWVDLAKTSWNAPYFIDKIKIWFMYPGWLPRDYEKPALPVKYDPDEPVRFKTKMYRGLNWYIGLQLVFVSLATTWLLFAGDALSASKLATAASMVLITSLAWGGLFERKAWAMPLEFARLIAVACLTIGYFWASSVIIPVAISVSLVTTAFAIWMLRCRRIFFRNENNEQGSEVRNQGSALEDMI